MATLKATPRTYSLLIGGQSAPSTLAVIPFEREDEVVEMANSTIYGLPATIWTNDVKRAHHGPAGPLTSASTTRP